MLTRACSSCGKEFTISDSEIALCAKKNLTLPVLCKECRAAVRPSTKNKEFNRAGKGKSGNYAVDIYMPKTELKDPGISKTPTGKLVMIILIISAIVLGCVYAAYNSYDKAHKYPGSESYKSSIVTGVYEHPFLSEEALLDSFAKYGQKLGASNPEIYIGMANKVLVSDELLQQSASDGSEDTVYFLESEGKIVRVNSQGYIVSFFPGDFSVFTNQ